MPARKPLVRVWIVKHSEPDCGFWDSFRLFHPCKISFFSFNVQQWTQMLISHALGNLIILTLADYRGWKKNKSCLLTDDSACEFVPDLCSSKPKTFANIGFCSAFHVKKLYCIVTCAVNCCLLFLFFSFFFASSFIHIQIAHSHLFTTAKIQVSF